MYIYFVRVRAKPWLPLKFKFFVTQLLCVVDVIHKLLTLQCQADKTQLMQSTPIQEDFQIWNPLAVKLLW